MRAAHQVLEKALLWRRLMGTAVLDPGVPVIRIAAVEGSLVKKGAKVRLQGTRTGSNAVVNRITLQ